MALSSSRPWTHEFNSNNFSHVKRRSDDHVIEQCFMDESVILAKLDEIALGIQYNPAQSQMDIDHILNSEIKLNRVQYLRAVYYKGIAYMFMENFQGMVIAGEEIRKNALSHSDDENLLRAYSLLGIGYCYSNEYYESLRYISSGIKLAQTLNSKLAEITFILNVAQVMMLIRDYKQAEDYYHLAIAESQKMNNSKLILKATVRMSELKLICEDLQAAHYLLSEVEDQVDDDLDSLSLFHYHILKCELFVLTGSLDKAKVFLDAAAQDLKDLSLIQLDLHFNRVAGLLECYLENYEQSESYLDQAWTLANQLSCDALHYEIIKAYILFYEKTNQIAKALEFTKKLVIYEQNLIKQLHFYDLFAKSIGFDTARLEAIDLDNENRRLNEALKHMKQKQTEYETLESIIQDIDLDCSVDRLLQKMQQIAEDHSSVMHYNVYALELDEMVCTDLRSQVIVELSELEAYDIISSQINGVLSSHQNRITNYRQFIEKTESLLLMSTLSDQRCIIHLIKIKEPRDIQDWWIKQSIKLMNQLVLIQNSAHSHVNPDISVEARLNFYQLSGREKEIVKLVLSGCSNIEISTQLMISKFTVRNHLSKIFPKMNVKSRIELIQALSTKNGIMND